MYYYTYSIICIELYNVDPKDNDLYMVRVKSFERLMEARSITDVQIVC